MRTVLVVLSTLLLSGCVRTPSTPDAAFARDFMQAAGVKPLSCPARYAEGPQEGREEGVTVFCGRGQPDALQGGVLDAVARLKVGTAGEWGNGGAATDNLSVTAGFPGESERGYGIGAEIDRNDPRLLILYVFPLDE